MICPTCNGGGGADERSYCFRCKNRGEVRVECGRCHDGEATEELPRGLWVCSSCFEHVMSGAAEAEEAGEAHG